MKADKSVQVAKRANGSRQIVASDAAQIAKLERYLATMKPGHKKRAAYEAQLKALKEGQS